MGIVRTKESRLVTVEVVSALCDGCGRTHEVSNSHTINAPDDFGADKGWCTLMHGDGASGTVRLVTNPVTYVLCIACMGRVREALAALPKLAERMRED